MTARVAIPSLEVLRLVETSLAGASTIETKVGSSADLDGDRDLVATFRRSLGCGRRGFNRVFDRTVQAKVLRVEQSLRGIIGEQFHKHRCGFGDVVRR